MKKIFLWTSNPKYAEYEGSTPEDEKKICWNIPVLGEPLPPLVNWIMPVLTQYKKHRKIGDSLSSGSVMLISKKAVDALKDIWDKHAILYPVKLDDINDIYYMVKIITIIDCLDESASKTTKDRKGYIRVVHEWVLRNNDADDVDLFVFPYDETTYYVSERFKNRVIKAGLKGFTLKVNFWDKKPFVS